MRARAI